MRDSIQYVKVEEREKILKALALAMEAGLANTLKGATQKSVFTSCSRMEKTSLQAILKTSTMATPAMEIRYHTGLRGAALLLIRMNDLFSLAELSAGIEAKIDDSLPPAVIEACIRFFSGVVEDSSARFSQLHAKTIACNPPELISADGKPASLMPLAAAYEGALCLSFQVIVEPHLDSRVQMLVQPELFESLVELLPEYDPNPPVQSVAAKRLEALKDAGETSENVVDTSEKSALKPSFVSPSPKRGGNWNIDLLLDVELPIVVCFGETEMQLKDVLKLGVGSVIELSKSVNDPVEVIVNEKPIARGEVVMVDGNYGVRILEVESTAERIRSLG